MMPGFTTLPIVFECSRNAMNSATPFVKIRYSPLTTIIEHSVPIINKILLSLKGNSALYKIMLS